MDEGGRDHRRGDRCAASPASTGSCACNYANGDMVGHTGNFRAATIAVEAVDLQLARLLPVIEAMRRHRA